MAPKKTTPVHAGEILLEEFRVPWGSASIALPRTSAFPLAGSTRSSTATVAISADTALRLARYFGTSERFWLNLQAQFDLDVERDRLGDRLKDEVAVRRAG